MNRIDYLVHQAEAGLTDVFAGFDAVETLHTRRLLSIFASYGLAQRHFAPSTGYGYNDIGRETLESIFADIFGTEAAIVRPHIASGTHAIALTLFGLSRPGDHILYVTGKPYDTLDQVIGLNGDQTGSLKEMRVDFSDVPLGDDGHIDKDAVKNALTPRTRVVAVQRSCGYTKRRALMPEDIAGLSAWLKRDRPDITLVADNCYGEFVTETEPTHFGADVCVGSLIKNPGGGLAPTGGYITGKKNAIRRVEARLTALGIGREIGSYTPGYSAFFQGLFMAPHTVAQALKSAALAAAVFSGLGMNVMPLPFERRSDIIQTIEMGSPARLLAFCRAIQAYSPVDSMLIPEAWDMPGYACKVIMAGGTFIAGSSIELSADAPVRPPYHLFFQGSLSFAHGKLAIINALARMESLSLI